MTGTGTIAFGIGAGFIGGHGRGDPWPHNSPRELAVHVDAQAARRTYGTPSALTYIKSGKLTAIGLTSLKRSANAPQIPTIAESLPGYEVELV